jgi:hypothetical protein
MADCGMRGSQINYIGTVSVSEEFTVSSGTYKIVTKSINLYKTPKYVQSIYSGIL